MPSLKGTTTIYDYDITDTIAVNLQRWLDYGLLEQGGYTAAKFDNSASGLTNLKRVTDNRYINGKVFEGFGPSWVWETDFSYPSGCDAPFPVSGVYVNNTFYPTATTSGAYAHSIDYLNGRVIFNSPVTSGTVSAQYVFRDIDVYLTDSHKWKLIVDEYEKRYETLETLSPSGMAAVLKENRVWLPSVILDPIRTVNRGLQLGGGELQYFTVNFFILADNSFIVNRLCDLLNNQYQKTLYLFNANTITYPYNFNGALASGALTYPTISNQSSGYFLTFAHITNVTGGSTGALGDLYRGAVVMTIEVPRYLSTY